MKISFSKHALYQLKERNLSRELAIETIENPSAIVEQENNRFRAVKLIRRSNKDFLTVVVYDKTNSHTEIVTVFITSKIRKYL